MAFELTADRLFQKWVKRTNDFRPDPKVKTKSATPNDYRRSDYDRGHLAAAGDMAFSEESMSESFYMSNMGPAGSRIQQRCLAGIGRTDA